MAYAILISTLVALSPFFTSTAVTAAAFVDDNVSWTKAPHHAPSYSPSGAPAPHHHHHHHHLASPPAVAPAPHHHHHHHHMLASPPTAHAPSYAPVVAPAPHHKGGHHHHLAPVQPPSGSPAPVHPPLPARKLVAVQGVVYCKACKYKGVDTLIGATPLKGAVVLLTCNNTKYPLRVKGTTDHNGYFFITPPKTLTTYGAHMCRVTLLTSPMATCNKPTNFHYGLKGSILMPNNKPTLLSPSPSPSPMGPGPVAKPLPYEVFTVGPFAFEPATPCAHETIGG